MRVNDGVLNGSEAISHIDSPERKIRSTLCDHRMASSTISQPKSREQQKIVRPKEMCNVHTNHIGDAKLPLRDLQTTHSSTRLALTPTRKNPLLLILGDHRGACITDHDAHSTSVIILPTHAHGHICAGFTPGTREEFATAVAECHRRYNSGLPSALIQQAS